MDFRKNKVWYLLDLNAVKNLTKQFMHFVHPRVYLIVNYKSQSYLDTINKNYQMIYQDIIEPHIRYCKKETENISAEDRPIEGENTDAEDRSVESEDTRLPNPHQRMIPAKLLVVGVNYDNRKTFLQMKKKILQWCVDKKKELTDLGLVEPPEINYIELTKIDLI